MMQRAKDAAARYSCSWHCGKYCHFLALTFFLDSIGFRLADWLAVRMRGWMMERWACLIFLATCVGWSAAIFIRFPLTINVVWLKNAIAAKQIK